MKSFILGLFLALIFFSLLRAQDAAPSATYTPPPPSPDANSPTVATSSQPVVDTNAVIANPAPASHTKENYTLLPPTPGPSSTTASPAPNDNNAAIATPTPANQTPDDVIKKLSDLIHAGKYPEAQQLAAGLLLAYPDDQRLVKAKSLLDKLLATSNSSQPADSIAQSAPNATPEQLTGMDKVEYNSLIEMAKEAQQNTDLDQQKASLKQFMDESGTFLQKYPDQMLLWEFRVAAALILDDPDAGYEAGQKLLATDAADSNDPNLQQLLSKLNIKGWLDKQKVEDYKKYGWILGTWRMSSSDYDSGQQQNDGWEEVFIKSDSGDVEGHFIPQGARENARPDMRGIILAIGEIRWEKYLGKIADKDGRGMDPESPGGSEFVVDPAPGRQLYPSGWQQPISYIISGDKRLMTLVFPRQGPKRNYTPAMQHPVTLVFEKISDSQN